MHLNFRLFFPLRTASLPPSNFLPIFFLDRWPAPPLGRVPLGTACSPRSHRSLRNFLDTKCLHEIRGRRWSLSGPSRRFPPSHPLGKGLRGSAMTPPFVWKREVWGRGVSGTPTPRGCRLPCVGGWLDTSPEFGAQQEAPQSLGLCPAFTVTHNTPTPLSVRPFLSGAPGPYIRPRASPRTLLFLYEGTNSILEAAGDTFG